MKLRCLDVGTKVAFGEMGQYIGHIVAIEVGENYVVKYVIDAWIDGHMTKWRLGPRDVYAEEAQVCDIETVVPRKPKPGRNSGQKRRGPPPQGNFVYEDESDDDPEDDE